MHSLFNEHLANMFYSAVFSRKKLAKNWKCAHLRTSVYMLQPLYCSHKI